MFTSNSVKKKLIDPSDLGKDLFELVGNIESETDSVKVDQKFLTNILME